MDLARFFDPDLIPEEGAAIEAAALLTGAVRRAEGPSLIGGLLHGRRDSLHCERIFGPLYADRCLCGRQVGAAFRGQTCPRCGVEVWASTERASRWGHLNSRVGIAHPRWLAEAATALEKGADPLAYEMDEDEVLEEDEDLQDEEDAPLEAVTLPLDALEAAWGRRIRVHAIPVSPPAGRLLPPDPRGLLPRPTAEEVASRRLIGLVARLDRLDELGAPAIVLAHSAQAAARGLADLFVARGTGPAPTVFSGPTAGGPPRLSGKAPRRTDSLQRRPFVDGLAFWGEQLVCSGAGGLRVVSLVTGRSRRIPATEGRVIGVVGDVVVLDALSTFPCYGAKGLIARSSSEAFAAQGFAAYDLFRRSWCTALPGAPGLSFGKDQPEDGWAVELATGRVVDVDVRSDRPAFGCYTPSLDAMMVLGDGVGTVLDGQTGFVLFDTAGLGGDRVRAASGRGRIDLLASEDRAGPPAMVHLQGRRWRLLLPNGGVGELDEGGGEVRWALGRPHSAAAFSPDGGRLALAEGRRLRVLDADGQTLRVISL
jgi:hypothetical protein